MEASPNSHQTTSGSPPPIVFAGPFPLPLTGQTNATEFIYQEALQAGLNLVRANIVRGNTKNKILNVLIRFLRVLRCMALIIFNRLRKASVLYLSVDANAGMYVTILLSKLARLLRYRIHLHHHTFSAISSRQPRMVSLVKAAGTEACHITICPFMSRFLVKHYPEIQFTATQSNAILLRPVESTPVDRGDKPFRIGFISRLSEEKGTLEVLKVFREVKNEGIPASLHLAGPRGSEVVWKEINQLQTTCTSAEFIVPGMLVGKEKQAFYENIDLFLFPTKYENETQGIVNLEALAYGVPVVAYGRCCITSDVGDKGGVVVPIGGDFTKAAIGMIKAFIQSPATYQIARKNALEQFHFLQSQASSELSELITSLKKPRIVTFDT